MSVNLLLIFFVLLVVAMIAFILVQKGTGATAGAAFGSGASSTVFGAKGSGNFLTKTTMMLAFLFFAISMFMAVEASKQFTVADTGEIDLGVVGTLDTSDSDVPEITPIGTTDEDDIPNLDIKTDAESTDAQSIDVDVPKVDDSALKDVAKDVLNTTTEQAEDIKSDAENAVEEIQSDADDKIKEIKDSATNG
ncbi:Protein translocase membrane subunit SecG [hydrothermal vent metagenome]|uniref:Protein translocase membrane subunit SecG n=1 Tax=hydrothermal vent metagenome TaxID=652676 RepID=A0A3B0V828_9ZZZZ